MERVGLGGARRGFDRAHIGGRVIDPRACHCPPGIGAKKESGGSHESETTTREEVSPAPPRRAARGAGVVGEHGSGHEHLEAFGSFEGTSLHSPAAEEDRDTPLDARAEPLPFAEGWTLLMSLAFRSLFPAALGNAFPLHSSFLTRLDVGRAVEAPVACVQLGRRTEELLVALQWWHDMALIGRVAIEDPIVGNEPDATFREEDLVAGAPGEDGPWSGGGSSHRTCSCHAQSRRAR